MGAENSVLEGCDWGDQLTCPNAIQWNITPVTKKDGMEAVVFQPKNSDKKDNNLLQKSAKMLKGLRHPNIVRFLGCGTLSDGFWLATEPVSPLLATVNDLGITSYELVVGVWDILQALDFLHSKLGVCHNNVCPASIYVSKDGAWKLGGMEHACKFLEATTEFLESSRAFRNDDCLAPEEKTGNAKLDMVTAHARDVFALGALVDSLMDFVRDRNDKSLEELEKQLTPCVSSDPSSRPTTSTLISSTVFRSEFIELVAFIKNVTVKTEDQKKKFFSTLLPKLQRLPEEVVARKLVLPLLSRFVLLDETAEEEVVPALLKPVKGDSKPKVDVSAAGGGGLLSESLFQVHVIPHVCNVFRVHDCHIRRVLLTHFHHYVHLFSREQLEDDIFLQILLGVRDTDDRLVAASLRALAELVPLLGGDYVVGGSRKCFFFHGIPKPVSAEDIQTLSTSTPNVGSVLTSSRVSYQMHPPSSNHDPNHKPLLKDLAYGLKSSSHSSSSSAITSTVTSEEKERKMREREQRREEARLKREERRKKAKTRQAIVSGADETTRGDSPEKSTPIIEKLSAFDRGEEKEKNLNTNDDDDDDDDGRGLNDLKEKEIDDDGLIRLGGDNNDDLFDKEAAVLEDEEDKPDWSDWDDADGNISDEIEEELRHMSQSDDFNEKHYNANNNKVPTSPNPYQKEDTLDRYPRPSSPSSAVEWSDISSSSSATTKVINSQSHSHHHNGSASAGTKGPLSLAGRKVNRETPQTKIHDSNKHEVLEPTSSSSIGAKALKLKNPNVSSSSTSTSSSSNSSSSLQSGGKSSKSTSKIKGPKKQTSDDLGLGYDIKSVEIKSKSEALTDDLFADMAPVISSSSSSTALSSSAISIDPIKDLLSGNLNSSTDNAPSTPLTSHASDHNDLSVKKTASVKTQDDDQNIQQAVVTNSALFAVDATSQGDQEDAGWGDEDGWGADDF